MDKKCTKYEGLFIFSDEETLKQHVSECEDCKREEELQNKVSSLIQEVKPYMLSRRRKKLQQLRVACMAIFMLFSSVSLGLVFTNDDVLDSLKYGDTLTAEELGFPVDSYGLLMVDE